MLGDKQWQWFSNELISSKADFNIIVSSIQVLSSEHGYESWGTMPNEQTKLFSLIKDSKAEGVIILSGDRHISEFSILSLGQCLLLLKILSETERSKGIIKQ